MLVRLFVILAIVAIGSPSTATAEPLEFELGTAEGLLKACTFSGTDQSEIEYHFGSCAGFIRGVRVTFETIKIAQGSRYVCPPDDTTNGQLRDLVVEQIRSSRSKLTDLSPIVVSEALTRAFPCPR